jgi:hypothetical protein
VGYNPYERRTELHHDPLVVKNESNTHLSLGVGIKCIFRVLKMSPKISNKSSIKGVTSDVGSIYPSEA